MHRAEAAPGCRARLGHPEGTEEPLMCLGRPVSTSGGACRAVRPVLLPTTPHPRSGPSSASEHHRQPSGQSSNLELPQCLQPGRPQQTAAGPRFPSDLPVPPAVAEPLSRPGGGLWPCSPPGSRPRSAPGSRVAGQTILCSTSASALQSLRPEVSSGKSSPWTGPAPLLAQLP